MTTSRTNAEPRPQPPRTRIIWQVLEGARDAGDGLVIAACRRLIVADRRGWKGHADPADIEIVWAFAD